MSDVRSSKATGHRPQRNADRGRPVEDESDWRPCADSVCWWRWNSVTGEYTFHDFRIKRDQ